jgi:hypothetical protein
MPKIATLLTVLMLTVAASAFAQDYRSPDARQQLATQDYRSPDAQQPVAVRAPDHRSPDARPSGAFSAAPAPLNTHASGSFAWGYLAAGTALALLVALGAGLTQRRRAHAVIGH